VKNLRNKISINIIIHMGYELNFLSLLLNISRME